jgi:tetratricopeptide (TPR) repeat protein
MPRFLLGTFLLIGTLFGQSTSPEDALRHAMKLQQSGDLEGAVRGYRDFLAVRPNEAGVRSNLGVLLSRLARYDEAIGEYQKAHALDPNNAGFVLNLGLAYYKWGHIEDAAKEFSKAHQMAPDNSQAVLLLADCQLRLGRNRDVIALLTPVEAERPEDLAIAYLLGTALIRDGQVEEGQKRVDQILRKGDSAEARLMMGSQMFAAGDFPAAVKQLEGALTLNPSLPGLQGLYGQALLNTGDPDAAADAFQKELANDPNHFESNLYLAQILVARKKVTEAEPLVRRALQVRPDSLDANLALADVQIGSGKLQEARHELLATEKKWPQSPSVHRKLSDVNSQLHLAADAAREKKLAASLEPKPTSTAAGPRTGDPAPEFTATKMGSDQKLTLAQLRNQGPVLLVFGSYTCPNFRGAADTLNKLYPQYRDRLPFFLIYIREAHSTTDWASTRNQREGIVLPPAANMHEREDHATMCVRKLRIEFPTLLDSMNGAAEKAYAAWPSKAYLIDKRGEIAFSTALGEQDFHPEGLEAALRRVSNGPDKESRLAHGAH